LITHAIHLAELKNEIKDETAKTLWTKTLQIFKLHYGFKHPQTAITLGGLVIYIYN
jgi:hypothetical protein